MDISSMYSVSSAQRDSGLLASRPTQQQIQPTDSNGSSVESSFKVSLSTSGLEAEYKERVITPPPPERPMPTSYNADGSATQDVENKRILTTA